MSLLWTIGGGLGGLPVGAVLRGVVFEMSVPSGTPDRTACPKCATPVRRLVPIRCGQCMHFLGPPVTLELATCVVLALLFGRFGGQPDMVAFAFLGALGVALGAIDIGVQRLPDRLTLPAYPVTIILLTVSAALGHDWGALLRGLLSGVVMGAGFLVLALLRPGHLGGGDVKLAGLAGLALGWLGWPTLAAGAVLGFFLSAAASLALLAARRITLRSAICFGPYLLGGALLAILASGQ